MSACVRTQQCYPQPFHLGNLHLPAPEPDHEHCPGGHVIEGVLGGWRCPCPCHHSAPSLSEETK